MKICFLIGSPDISGGTYVIYQHALFLKKECNYCVDIVSIFPATAENTVWHREAKEHLNFKNFEDVTNILYDVAIATWWKTILDLHRINAVQYVYFVQSIESKFYPNESAALRRLVDSTYEHGLPVITEASWIKNYLYTEYSSVVWLVINGVRKDIYKPYGNFTEKREGKLRVLVEGPINVEFKNVPRTIELCKKSKVDDIWLLTSSDIKHYSGVSKIFSRVPIVDTPSIYRSCDLIVKLSYVEGMFGPPLEMFHCGGTAIVYNVTGHDEYIQHNINALVANRDDERKVIEYLNGLQNNKALLNELKFEAQKTAFNWPDWSQSSVVFFDTIHEITKVTAPPDKKHLFEGIKNKFEEYVLEEQKFKTQNKT